MSPSLIVHDAVRALGDVLLVSDDHDRSALRCQLVEDREDLVGRLAVEVSGRLVGEDERRVGDQGAGDRDALLLPTRQLLRPVIRAVVRPTISRASSARRLRSAYLTPP